MLSQRTTATLHTGGRAKCDAQEGVCETANGGNLHSGSASWSWQDNKPGEWPTHSASMLLHTGWLWNWKNTAFVEWQMQPTCSPLSLLANVLTCHRPLFNANYNSCLSRPLIICLETLDPCTPVDACWYQPFTWTLVFFMFCWTDHNKMFLTAKAQVEGTIISCITAHTEWAFMPLYWRKCYLHKAGVTKGV